MVEILFSKVNVLIRRANSTIYRCPLNYKYFNFFSCDSSSISRNVGLSVCLSVGRSVGRSVPISFFGVFGVLRAVFSSPLLPNHTRLMLSCIRDSPLPLPSTLPLLPNTRDFSRFVYPALFFHHFCRKQFFSFGLFCT